MGGVGDNLIEVDPSVQRGMLLYGGPGHNILMAGSGNDVLVGGSGTSILEGGSGNDVLYGGAIPAVYQNLIDNLGAGSTAPASSGAPTSNALMTWLRQQPAGHNYLDRRLWQLAALRRQRWRPAHRRQRHVQLPDRQFVLAAGWRAATCSRGQATARPDDRRPAAGDAMIAGTGNSVLIGGSGENILEGGGGSDVLVGGSLINVMMSNDAAGATSYLLGGTGLNFEFAGAGNDQLFDYSNPSDPLQATAWNTARVWRPSIM